MNKPVIVLRCLKCMFSSLSACALVSICLIIASFVMRFLVLRERNLRRYREYLFGRYYNFIYRAAVLKFHPAKIIFYGLLTVLFQAYHARCLNVLPDFFLPALLLKENDCCVGVISCGCII